MTQRNKSGDLKHRAQQTQPDKSRENRFRRMAKRREIELSRIHQRDKFAPNFDVYIIREKDGPEHRVKGLDAVEQWFKDWERRQEKERGAK